MLVDIRLGDVELLGVDHREERPLHDVEPLVVAVAHDGPSGSLEMISGSTTWSSGLRELQALAVEAGTSVVNASQRPAS